MNSQDLTMDTILKMKPELFADFCKKQGITFVLGLQKLLRVQYSSLNLSRMSLVSLLDMKDKIEMPPKDVELTVNNLNEIYVAMQLIEDRYLILDEVLKTLKVDKSKH